MCDKASVKSYKEKITIRNVYSDELNYKALRITFYWLSLQKIFLLNNQLQMKIWKKETALNYLKYSFLQTLLIKHYQYKPRYIFSKILP